MMRNALAALLLAFGMSSVQAQTQNRENARERAENREEIREEMMDDRVEADEVPAEVRNQFQRKFASAQVNHWTKDDGMYGAHIGEGSNERVVFFNDDGAWLKTATRVDNSKVPAPVMKAMRDKYADWQLMKAYQVETAAAKNDYTLYATKGDDLMMLVYDKSGLRVHKED